MPTNDQQIVVAGTAPAPAQWVVPGNGQLQPKTINAIFDGTAASGVFLPTLELVSDAGIVIARVPASQVSVGGTAEVTWAPFLEENAAAQGGPPNFGCVRFVGPPTGVAATDTAALQAAHDSLPAVGGTVQACQGAYAMTQAGVTFSKNIQLAGHGRFVTEFQYPFTSGTPFNMTTTGTFTLRDLAIRNTAAGTPVSGSGIAVTGVNASGWQLLGAAVVGFFTNIDVQQSNSWSMSRCIVQDFVNTGLKIQNLTNGDQGDWTLQDSHFFTGPTNTGPTFGINWLSAGGGKLNACKFNGNNPPNNTSIAFRLAIADGVTTGSLSMVNNSVENYGYGVVFAAGGAAHSGLFDRVTIAGNEFECKNDQININPAVAGQYSRIAIAGNTLNDGVNGLVLGNCDNVTNGGNVFGNLSGSNVVLAAGLTNHTSYANG